ncbi:MAG: glycosyltransferase, partial [Pseudonocardiaceae bacterium]
MTAAALLVVAKSPVPGHAKTRLCPPATAQQAAAIAAAALLDTLDAARGRRTVVALSGRLDHAARVTELRAALARCRV